VEYIIESIEMLKRLANLNKPPLSIGKLEKIQVAFMDPTLDKKEQCSKLEGMTDTF
jgi:hypothetical protein